MNDWQGLFFSGFLTDRAFITRERTMLRAFIVAGALGFCAILAFSLIGVHARLEGIAANGNVPAAPWAWRVDDSPGNDAMHRALMRWSGASAPSARSATTGCR